MQGVYVITCQPTGEQYVGYSSDIEKRWQTHMHNLKRSQHHSRLFQRAFDVYGSGAFTFEVVEEVADECRLAICEEYWIVALQPALNIAGMSRQSKRRIVRTPAPRGRRVPHLRAIREKRCLSQTGLAQLIGTSPQPIVRGERGSVIAFATIAELAKALHVAPAELTADSEAS